MRFAGSLLLFLACEGSRSPVPGPGSFEAAAASPASSPAAEPEGAAARTDLLTFANGAVPVGATGLSRASERLVFSVDGDPTNRNFYRGPADATVSLTFELPAPTTFESFAVPRVEEVPGKNNTFYRTVAIHGSSTGPDSGFEELARGELSTHAGEDEVTELAVSRREAVRWVRLELSGGIRIEDPASDVFLNFSELVGHGVQEPVALTQAFSGRWEVRLAEHPDRRGDVLRLAQEGASVEGCWGEAEITGTVSGNILRATGVDRSDGTRSSYLLVASPSGLQGLVSQNGAPFSLKTLPAAAPDAPTMCDAVKAAPVGCGSTVYINFEYDSATIRPESAPVLADLYAGLKGEQGRVTLVGHTSTEGAEPYNQALSERRAQAVVDDLVRRGLDAGRIEATGKGEEQPIASDADEAGRALNRRVEVRCAG
jgi:outer membrane protein OmpA-like peptidoglycan-associated protein